MSGTGRRRKAEPCSLNGVAGDPPVWGMREFGEAFGFTEAYAAGIRRQSLVQHSNEPGTVDATTFPLPDWNISGIPVWRPKRIMDWAEATGRLTPNGELARGENDGLPRTR